MQVKKKHLENMHRCYSVSNVKFDDKNHLFMASEDPNVGCNMYYGKDFKQKQNVWMAPGGCMSIVTIPNKEKEILAVQEFYLKVSDSQAKIVWGKLIDDKWVFTDFIHLPFVHRFGILNRDGVNYLAAATIATSKERKDDWSVPGRIYVGRLPEKPTDSIKLEVLVEGLYRNHGLWKTQENHIDVAYFGSDQGIIKVTPPSKENQQFQVEPILQTPVGEIAVIDIDGDGQNEIMTIEPFHGNTIQIYKKIDGSFRKVWQYDQEIDFAHALAGAKLCGKNVFVCGVRRCSCELFIVAYDAGDYHVTTIDKGAGPANLCVINEKGRDIIAAANHTAGEAAIYVVEGD